MLESTIKEWVSAVQKDPSIPEAAHSLALSDCEKLESGSNIGHTGYLRLRTVWYCYNTGPRMLATLITGNERTEYQGYVHPALHSEAERLVKQASSGMHSRLGYYLDEMHRSSGDARYLYPETECGFFSAVRYWQAMTATHVKTDRSVVSKISISPGSASNNQTVVTPPRNDTHRNAQNSASVDETYVNTALLLLLQGVCQEFKQPLRPLHWVPPRMALHVKVPGSAGKKKELLEARVDGYLCGLVEVPGTKSRFTNPKAICEAKAAVRKSHRTEIERQESAEMAAWISSDRGAGELLQTSASGRRRRLMVSQDRDEIYIIIGEYGEEYERYIQGLEPKHVIPPINTQNADPADRSAAFQDSLGSPTFLLRLKGQHGLKKNVIEGWGAEELGAVNSEPQTDVRRSDRIVGGKSDPEYFSADRCLIMHRFGPWETSDPEHMKDLVTQLLALMLQLNSASPQDHHNTGASAGTPRSTSGSRSGTSTRSSSSSGGSSSPGGPSHNQSREASRGRPPKWSYDAIPRLDRPIPESPSIRRDRRGPVDDSARTQPRALSESRLGRPPLPPTQRPRELTPPGGSSGLPSRPRAPIAPPEGQPRGDSPPGNNAGRSQPRNPPTTGGGPSQNNPGRGATDDPNRRGPITRSQNAPKKDPEHDGSGAGGHGAGGHGAGGHGAGGHGAGGQGSKPPNRGQPPNRSPSNDRKSN